MHRASWFLFLAGFLLAISGCGGQYSMASNPASNTTSSNVPVSIMVTDTPPAGVTVLFFQLSITGATLATTSGSVSLLNTTNPIPINITQLQTDAAFLGSANVPAGTYNSLSVTFANPQLTIFNDSGAAIGSCANNTVCQLTPTTTPSTLTFSTTPFPVTLAANSPLAFKLDIHLDTIIQQNLSVDLSATDGVTVSQLPTPPQGAPFSPIGHLIGTIQSLGTNAFTLQTGDGRTFNVGVNSSTTYNYPSSVCTTANFACLATQQIVKVKLSLLSAGTLLATEVNFVQPVGQNVLEGDIIRLSSSGGNTVMDLIVQQGAPMPMFDKFPFGQRASVTVPSTGVTYVVDSGSFAVPSGLSFASSTDLAVGQEVSVVVQGSVAPGSGTDMSVPFLGPAAIALTTNSISLEPSQITGSVAAINASASSFTLSTFPFGFVPPAATQGALPTLVPFNLTVQTTSATTFTNLTPDTIAGLSVNDVVSVGGWIFSTPSGSTTITQAADTVVGRPGPVALF
jgi:uncharacterized protein DUF4382/uncharacterized protein DUF5666